jgi:hypothetical protein
MRLIKIIDDYMTNEYDHRNKKIVNEDIIRNSISHELDRIRSYPRLKEINNVFLVKYFKKCGNVSNYYNFVELIRDEINKKQNNIFHGNKKRIEIEREREERSGKVRIMKLKIERERELYKEKRIKFQKEEKERKHIEKEMEFINKKEMERLEKGKGKNN